MFTPTQCDGLRDLADCLTPNDPVRRYVHLFINQRWWDCGPDARWQDVEARRRREQIEALLAVFEAQGQAGLSRLVETAKHPFFVGRTLIAAQVSPDALDALITAGRPFTALRP